MREWLKRLQIKGFIAGVLVTVMLSGTLLVMANQGGVMREVFYGVGIVVNGQRWNPPADMVPFIADGRTFLPVRGIAELLDVPVEWHGPTQTVYIGTMPHGLPFWATVPPFEQSSTAFLGVGPVTMMGNPYANAIRTTNRVRTDWSHHNLNAQFSTFTGTIGRIDGTSGTTQIISFIGDGRELAAFTIDENIHPTDISVDVSGILVLRIEFSGAGMLGGVEGAIANAMIQ